LTGAGVVATLGHMGEISTDTTIRPAVAADMEAVAELWCQAFPGKRTVAERVRMLESGGRYGGLETVLVARDGAGRLRAACKIYRLTQHIAGVAMPMMGLAAVAVAPGARRQGLGARLCTRAMEAARERGDVISTLYPFRADYYGRLGWGLVGELHEYRARTGALPAYEERRHVRTARGAADAEAIAACYARVAARSNGPIARDARIWAYRLAGEELGVRLVPTAGEPDAVPAAVSIATSRRHVAVVHDHGGVAGYALFTRPRHDAAESSATQVRELVAETEEAYRGLLGHLARDADRWPIVRHTARPEERLGDRLADPRWLGARPARSLYFPTARIIRGPMLRVLHVPAALGLRPFFATDADPAARQATLEIEIDDPQVPANRGPWIVRIHGGTGRVDPRVAAPGDSTVDAPADGASADARIHTDAATFARIFAGEIAPRVAARVGRAVTTGDAQLLDQAFAVSERFWLLDEF
jgi:predicted acetyltransferase